MREASPSAPAARAMPPASVDAFIGTQPSAIRPLLDACREFLHGTAPGLQEGIKWRIPTFMRGQNLFYLNPQADHVILGFCAGAKMPEFRNVFDRVLAEVAHVVVRRPEDLTRPGLRAAVRSAAGMPAEEPVSLRDREPAYEAARGTMRSLPPK